MTQKDIGSIQHQLARPGSALQKYRRTTVGGRSYLWLFLCEAVFCAVGSVPGDFGFKLRSAFYPLLFKKVGSSVAIGRDCSFRRSHRIELNDNVRLGDKVALDVKSDSAGISLGRNVSVGSSTIFSCPGGKIIIGDGTRIGPCSRLGSLLGLTVGRGCVIGSRTYIVGAGHIAESLDCPIIEQPLTCKGPNTLGDNVTIGDRVTILDGVTIGSDAVVGPGSLVIRNVPSGTRVSGVPARSC